MIGVLEAENENLREQCAHAPNDHLKEPDPHVDCIVRVEIIVFVDWYTLIRVYATFQFLKFNDKVRELPNRRVRVLIR